MKKRIPSYFNFNQLTPPGGGIELHETLEEACKREVNEETGLVIANPILRGVVSYISHVNNGHAVTMFFVSTDVSGELQTMEPEKHAPEWVSLAELPTDERVPDYYRELIIRCIHSNQPINATLQWMKPDGRFQWSIH